MWRITWRDLVYRRRRFLIAVAATALVFAVTLLLSGVLSAIHSQNHRIVASFEADRWWVGAGVPGPFSAGPSLASGAVDELAALAGVERADPVLLLRTAIAEDDQPVDVNLIGLPTGGAGSPPVSAGRGLGGPGELVVDEELGIGAGASVTIAGRSFAVVGVASGVSYLFAVPTVYMTLTDAQSIGAGGQPVISAVITEGDAVDPPAAYDALDDAAVLADLERPLRDGLQSIELVRAILAVTALAIVGFIIYLSSLERSRDVAVLKATGATGGFVAIGMVAQGVAVTLLAAAVAAVLANGIAPVFPMTLELTAVVYGQLLAVAVVVGVLASLAGVRRAVQTDPALAFG